MAGRTGKVAVITGGASGIGLALARRLADEGMRLVLGDVEVAALDEATDHLAKAGAEVVGLRCDVAQLGQVEEMRDAALERYGAVDLVVNNAGVTGGSAASSPRAIWDWVIGVNLVGVVNGVNAFLPHLLEQGEGHIVNTASVAGFSGVPGMGPYCATKAAVVAFSQSLFHELALMDTSVRVSVLCPGFVQTQIHRSDRNLPEEIACWADTEEARFLGEMARAAVEGGAPVSVVVDRVIEALDDGRFWILPHPRVAEAMVAEELGWLRGGPLPRFDLAAAGRTD
jgi:NAD(P)-dependent dehydrogenase (short-subunit alcohol dehydrogenase family)